MTDTKIFVYPISDTDDYDGLTSCGAEHRSYDGVLQFNVACENGWWEDKDENDVDPFLLFYKGEKPSEELQMRAVAGKLLDIYQQSYVEGLFSSSVIEAAVEPEKEPFVPFSFPKGSNKEYKVVKLEKVDFVECAQIGMKLAGDYSDFVYYLDEETGNHYIICCFGWNYPDYEKLGKIVRQYRSEG